MDPKKFFQEIVIWNYDMFSRNTVSYALAFNAFTSAYHLFDHLCEHQKIDGRAPTKAQKRTQWDGIANACDALRIASDVANAFKHMNLTKPNGAIKSLDQVDMIGKFMLEDESGFIMTEDGGYLLKEDAEICITMDDGTTRSAAEVLRELMAFWSDRLEPV